MSVTFEPLHRHYVAAARGFDIREPLGSSAVQTFEDAIDRFAVLAFPAQQVDDAQQLALTANFGPPDIRRKKSGSVRGQPLAGRNERPVESRRKRLRDRSATQAGIVVAGHAALALRQFVSAFGGEIFHATGDDGAAVGRGDRVRGLPSGV